MIKEDIKFQNSTVFEGMTSIRSIIKGNELRVNDRKIERILFDKEKYQKNAKNIAYLKAVSKNHSFDVLESNENEINEITLGSSHGGIIAIAKGRTIPCLDLNSYIKPNGFYCLIEGIEDPYNFGYSLRSLYACGCDGIILPERNWMSAAGVVARSSAGASELFPVFTSDTERAVDIFHSLNYSVICADERTDNILGECEIKLPLLLIVGGEKRGISKNLLNKTDMSIKINYAREFKASLSAASATTMFAYEIMRQNKKLP
ncbi:MAG: RNA methyltransferase [Ruminococcaceae bacterium]|nr:RNA methyltransferase [Oscillospiraceae bacterium]